MTDNMIEYILWPFVIGANIAAYYWDYYRNQRIEDEEQYTGVFVVCIYYLDDIIYVAICDIL